MTTFSRSASLLVARTGLVAVMLSFAALGAWTAGDLLGRPAEQKKPRVEEDEEEAPKAKKPPRKARVEEEEETPRKKPKRKVIRVEEEEEAKAKASPKPASAPAASGDLAQRAEQAKNPAVKKLFASLAVPHDVVRFKRTPGVTVNGERTQIENKVEPISLYLGTNPSRHRRELVRFTPLTHDWHRGKPYERYPDRLEMVWPYEEIAQDKVRRFLDGKLNGEDSTAASSLSRYDKLVAAEQALSAVLRWHESARQTGKRDGEEWAAVEKSLRKQLLDEVLLEQMKVLTKTKEWDRVLDLAHRLAVTYPDAVERQRIFRPVADMIRDALQDQIGSETTKQKARERLRELEREFPDNPAFQPISDTLRSQAQNLLDAARAAHDKKDEKTAHQYLLKARKTWPELPELRVFESKLNREHPTLRVGVRGPLPKYFSPAWACTDNEYRAVDLLFESLVKLVPDEAGGFCYRPGLAETRPRVVSMGRQFQLPQHAVWSDGSQLSATDIDFSFRSLHSGQGVGRSRVWSEPFLGVERKRNPFRVTLRMKQGFLDPLALMSFKILPVDKEVNSEEFATHPVTSGPFQLDRSRQSDESQRPCLFFQANPSYASRPTKRGAPHLQEIRFYPCSKPVEEITSGKLDLVLDLTAEQAQTLLEKQTTDGKPIEVSLPSRAVPNRRIYFLAINNRKFPDVKQRLAMAHAIDRVALLDKYFRAGLKERVHKPLNGPFPVGSWACPELSNQALDLYDAVAAKNQSLKIEKPAGLTLKYPQDQPGLKEAMKDLCTQVKERTGIVLEPTACDPYQLREDVEQRQSYDVAYYHYDFPDEIYWLAPLLGPPPRAAGNRNMFQLSNPTITDVLAKMESYRDFSEVRKHQRTLHMLLRDEMPFIPLWQLDPLLAYRRNVQPAALDPQLVFRNIEEWRKHD